MSATEAAQPPPVINGSSSAAATPSAAPTRSATMGGQNTSLGTFGVGDLLLGLILAS